ncbi:hypothetical protein F5146DRAFT_1003252 [Armillaria mellea]|nr:hypothetical protein F5146DRAFT_1003252 [Armillaria mellea]
MANQVMFQIGTQAHLESLFGTDIKWQVLSILVFAKAPVTSSETECICAYSNGLDLYDLHEGINGMIATLYKRWLDEASFIERSGKRTMAYASVHLYTCLGPAIPLPKPGMDSDEHGRGWSTIVFHLTIKWGLQK